MEEPLISIGVPTYNRPESLFKTLNAIVNQSYLNLEIIVSDNCSPDPVVQNIINEFVQKDSRVINYTQSHNIGPFENFNFVLTKASGAYFMWAADDDQWLGVDFLASLAKYSKENILTFPDAVTTDEPKLCLLTSYETCKSKIDYAKNFCTVGWGYPFYGLYNLKLFNQYNLKFQFDNELAYYSEGTFLHKLFLSGPVKYVKEAKILYRSNGSRPSNEILIDNFVSYFKSTLLIYANSNLSQEDKAELLSLVLTKYTAHFRSLFENFISFNRFAISHETAGVKKRSITGKIWFRLKRASAILIKGN